MILSHMIAIGEDELICDLAETYHIYDHRSLSPRMAAIFSCGLRNDSRIKMKMAEVGYTSQELLSVMIYDRLAWLCWANSEAAREDRDRPEPLLNVLIGKKDSDEDILCFDSPEEFEKCRELILKGGLLNG